MGEPTHPQGRRDPISDLERLQSLRDSGAISDQEFKALKAQTLGSARRIGSNQRLYPTDIEVDYERGWSSRQVVIVGIGFIIAIALASAGLADVFCDARIGEGTSQSEIPLTGGYCFVQGESIVYGFRGAFPLIAYVSAAIVLVLAIIVAFMDFSWFKGNRSRDDYRGFGDF